MHVHNTHFLTKVFEMFALPSSCLTTGVIEKQTAAEEEVDPVEEELREHIEREKKL